MPVSVISVILFIGLLVLMCLGVPIGFSMAVITVVGLLWIFDASLLFQLAQISVDLGSSFVLLVVPLFVAMAEFLVASGDAERSYTAAGKWFNGIPGGLAISSVAGCTIFAALCGSSPVTAATIGRVAIPEMTKRGYKRHFAAGSVACAGTLGIMIPPSLSLILYGVLTGTSIGKLFMAGIIPGLVLGIMMCLYVVAIAWLKPSMAPPTTGSVGWSDRFKAILEIGRVLVLIIFVLGSIYLGLATPTESAAGGAVGAFILFLFSGNFSWKEMMGCLVRAASITSTIMIVLIGGTAMAFLMSSTGLPQAMVEFIVSIGLGPWQTVIMISLVLLFLGSFLDPMGILVLTLPLFMPMIREFGFDPIWFGVLVVLNIEIGMITPPMGLNLYVLKAVVPDVEITEIIFGSGPFLLIMILAMILLMLVPGLALYLPGRMMF